MVSAPQGSYSPNLTPARRISRQPTKETTNEHSRCQSIADRCPPHADRPETQGRAGNFGRPERPARRHVCSVSEDEELSLAHLGSAFSRLPPSAGGAR